MGSLSNLYISQSYQSLIHLATNNTASATLIDLQDGLGNSIGVSVNTNGDLFLSGSLTASLQQGYLYVGGANGKTYSIPTSSIATNVNTGSLVTTSSFNQYTSSTNNRLNNLESTSASVNISISNLNSTTASQAISISNLNAYTQSNNAKWTNLENISGAWITESETASFAYINKNNNWSANQTFTNITAVSASFQYVQTTYETSSIIYSSGSNQLGDELTDIQTLSGSVKVQGSLTVNGINVLTSSVALTSLNAFTQSQYVSNSFFATTGSNTFVGNQTINPGDFDNGDVTLTGGRLTAPNATIATVKTNNINNDSSQPMFIDVAGNSLRARANTNVSIEASNGVVDITGSSTILSNTFTASLQQGYVWVGNASGRTTTVATSSFGSTIDTGSFVTTSSFNSYTSSNDAKWTTLGNLTGSLSSSVNQLNVYTASNDAKWNALQTTTASFSASVASISSKTGSYATTGSNNFVGAQKITNPADASTGAPVNGVILTAHSGSLILTNNNFTTGSYAYLSASSAGQTNIIFQQNSTGADTIISGSFNIMSTAAAPTAGFKRFVGIGNIALGASNIPQISGSMGNYTTMINNYFGGNATTITMRGPISSSTWTIAGNTIPSANAINLGTAAATNFEKAISGLNFNNNVINGSLVGTAYKTTLSSSVAINTNFIAGQVAMNLDSSSFTLTQNNINGIFTINNSYLPGTITAASATVAAAVNIIGGNLTLYTSGSNTTFTGPARQYTNSLSTGNGNVISASLNGDNSSVNSNNLLGQALLAYGNNTRTAGSTAADWGSAYVGRWNDINGNKAYTADTVFLVGTGTGVSTRKTGFLIDSGSNTFVEGTFNVSGSTSISGSTSMTGSLTLFSSSVAPSDLIMYGHKMFNVGAFQSGVTQSGSANVSQSMNFGTTDISQGVSIVSNSRITLANSGTYNIQFSAQFDRVSGSGNDVVNVWLKKNGVNYNSSAGALTLSGGANQAKAIAAWNYVVDTLNTDYWELCWQSTDSNIQLISFPASGNIPSIPSIILTVTQVR